MAGSRSTQAVKSQPDRLIQDSREPYPLEAKNLPVVVRTLEAADINIVGLERRWGVEAGHSSKG